MKTILPLILGLALSSVALSSVASGDEEPPKKDAQPKDFVGTWVGKWDGMWEVRFTFTEDPKSGKLTLVYEWEETVGEPFQKASPDSNIKIEKNTLLVDNLEVTLSAKDPDKALAKGKFVKPRTAALTREKVKGP